MRHLAAFIATLAAVVLLAPATASAARLKCSGDAESVLCQVRVPADGRRVVTWEVRAYPRALDAITFGGKSLDRRKLSRTRYRFTGYGRSLTAYIGRRRIVAVNKSKSDLLLDFELAFT